MSMLVTALLSSAPAHALSCAMTYVIGQQPTDGAVDVPVNVVPVLRIYDASPPGSGEWNEVDISMTDLATGEELALTVEVIESDGPTVETWLLHPDAPLPASTDIAVSVQSIDAALDEQLVFSTGTEEDLEAPESAAADSLSYSHEEDEWGSWKSLTVGLTGGADHPDNWWYIELADNPDFIDAQVRTSITRPARFSSDPCSADAAAAEQPGETWLRITTFDSAGNAAEPEVTYFEEAGGGGTGCSTVATSPGPLGALAGLIGLLAVGRRRS